MPSLLRFFLILLIFLSPYGLWAQHFRRRAAFPIGPPQRRHSTPSRISRMQMPIHPPSVKPPKGVAGALNKAKLKDFMKIGKEILRKRRLLQAKARH